MMRPRPRWHVIQRMRRLQHDPLGPLVLVGMMAMVAYWSFVWNWLTHQW